LDPAASKVFEWKGTESGMTLFFALMTQALAATVPVQGTDIAGSWDVLYWFLIYVSAFFVFGILAVMIYFAIRFRRQESKRPKFIEGNTAIEVVWTVIPTILVMVMFVWGWVVYKKMIHAPSNAMEIRVIGKQWLWQFVYPDGQQTIGDLYVPLNRPVKLIMSSEDVLHSFFIPNFRVKQDVVPGMYTHVWFESKIPGIHQIYCTEYCGASHSGMLARLLVLKDDQWKSFLAGNKIDPATLDADPTFPGFRANMLGEGLEKTAAGSDGAVAAVSLASQGKTVAQSKGCIACHSADGSKMTGPTWKGLAGSTRQFTDGSEGKADDAYLRESIENSSAKIVAGYPAGQMPVYKGLFTEVELAQVIEYIKSLK
jgi:cytochrome c oxidase subunit II